MPGLMRASSQGARRQSVRSGVAVTDRWLKVLIGLLVALIVLFLTVITWSLLFSIEEGVKSGPDSQLRKAAPHLDVPSSDLPNEGTPFRSLRRDSVEG